MPINFVQVKHANNPGSTQVSTSINVTAGDVLVVAGANGGAAGNPYPTFTDTLGTNFQPIKNLYCVAGEGFSPNPPGQTCIDQTINSASVYQLSIVVGLIKQTGQDIVTSVQLPQFGGAFSPNGSASMFVSAAEYSGVFISGSSVLINNPFGEELNTFGNVSLPAPTNPTNWLICAAIMLNASDFSGPGFGSLRVNDTQPLNRFVYLDSNVNGISFNEGSSSLAWFLSTFELVASPPPPPPPQLPAAIWPSIVPSQINKTRSDRIYPYTAFSVVPTLMTMPWICLHCGVGSQATIYRDVRDFSVAIGIPSPARGGIQAGQSFDFLYCGSCGYWYRKNDFKRVRNINIVDFGINPNLDPGENETTAFLDEPEYMEAQANIAGDSVRIASNANLNGFTDQWERGGFQVIPVPTGSLDVI